METTISAKSRNLGLGWSNRPVQQWNNSQTESFLVIAPPEAPKAEGGLRTVEMELGWARKVNDSNDWTARLFVANRLVTARWDAYSVDEEQTEWREGWVPVKSRGAVSQLLGDLREGQQIRVRLAVD